MQKKSELLLLNVPSLVNFERRAKPVFADGRDDVGWYTRTLGTSFCHASSVQTLSMMMYNGVRAGGWGGFAPSVLKHSRHPPPQKVTNCDTLGCVSRHQCHSPSHVWDHFSTLLCEQTNSLGCWLRRDMPGVTRESNAQMVISTFS